MPPIYHITHISNLERIIQTQGLWCDAERLRQRFDCIGIAHQDLKARRARTVVPVVPGGNLADYVPFYFANRSPMLYSIHKGFVENYAGGQTNIIYLSSSVTRVAEGNRPWCFTDGHAVEALTRFYCDPMDLNQLDWAVISDWSWKNTDEDPDRKRRKQAEVLVYHSFPWAWVDGIGVINATVAQRVDALLVQADHQPPVIVRPNWYY